MLIVDSPLALRPFLARHTQEVARHTHEVDQHTHGLRGVDLCELVRAGLDCSDRADSVRVHCPDSPARCAGQLPRVRRLIAALLAVAQRESPQKLGSELTIECLPSHVSITITSDRATQTAELGPLFEAFNAYAASLAEASRSSSRGAPVGYTPRMKIISCSDRRLSRVRVGFPYAPRHERDALQQERAYEDCRRVG